MVRMAVTDRASLLFVSVLSGWLASWLSRVGACERHLVEALHCIDARVCMVISSA